MFGENIEEQEANEIIEDFALELKVLIGDHGQKKIRDILMQLEPKIFDPSTVMPPGQLAESNFLLEKKKIGDGQSWCEYLPKTAKKARMACAVGGSAKDILMGLLGVGAGAAGGLAVGATKMAIGREFDQDVNIADQDIDLKVVSPSLEQMIVQTNALLQSMLDLLGATAKEQDDNLDYLSSAITGDSVTSIKGAQATISPEAGAREPDIHRAHRPERKSLEPKKKEKKKKEED